MKNNFLLFIFSFCFILSAFSQKVISLHPLFTEQDAILLTKADGKWNVSDFDMDISIHKAGDNFYFLKYGTGNNSSTFEAVFVKINDEYYLDMAGTLPTNLGDYDYRKSFIPGHTIFKTMISNDTMHLLELNYAWFYNYVINNKYLSYEWIDNAMLLTSKTDELKSFFVAYTNDKDFFKDGLTLLKKQENTETEKAVKEPLIANKGINNNFQQCQPEFPFTEGWLGGDGDVSVPISSTQTLFIFSDTYVGKKNQKRRMEEGMKMVSNTVAIETCLPHGKTEVHYFWNNMYSDNPEPIFKSFTERYRYWVNDAFIHKGNLYVLLVKVASKEAMAPGDLFSFSLPGFTLAKISNPLDIPIQWKIELIPLPGFANPLKGLQARIILDNYLYFFISRNDKTQHLVRKNLDFIDNPEKSFEYYALDKTWKTGINTDDMDTLINGFRSNTVNYHSDIRKWVMVCDIRFLDNKINIRTAPELTGPWSDEKVVYECPEVTEGSDAYSKFNFCYLPRECIQNYDSKTHTMLITYDISNSSYSEINSNEKIYTPKIIKLSLKDYVNR